MKTSKSELDASLELAHQIVDTAKNINKAARKVLDADGEELRELSLTLSPVALSMMALLHATELMTRAIAKSESYLDALKQEREGKDVCYANVKSEHPC